MINITDKIQCCGCNACGDVCAHHAITFKTDIEGFWYPEVNKDLCVDCGLCEKVCPIIHPENCRKGNDERPLTYILQLNDNKERFNSTSGCLYPIIAKHILENGGWVAGHVYDSNFMVHQYITNKLEDLEVLRNSKYLQSDLQGFYKQIKLLLKKGEHVLASGTPCQMAALKNYLRKDYINLITIDFTCMGIDSPLAFRKYLDSLEEIYGAKIKEFKSKCKEVGWRRLANKVIFENGKTYFGINGKDPNLNATFLDILDRPSCYDCKFKGYKRIADISIGDYWTREWNNYENLDFSIDDNSGTSYIMLNNQKAKDFFTPLLTKFTYKITDVESIVKGNKCALESLPKPTFDRDKFYEELHYTRFDKLIESRKKKLNRLSYRSIFKLINKHFKENNYSLWQLIRFLYYNFFCKHIESNFRCGNIIYTNKHIHFKFYKNSKLIIKGACVFKDSFSENKFILGENSNLLLDGCIISGGNVFIKLWKNAKVNIQYLSSIDSGTKIECLNKININQFCHIGRNVSISDNNNMILTTDDNCKITKDVTIGTHCLILDNSKILKGSTINDEAIITENSVVTGNIAARTVIKGNQANIIKKNIYWKNNL